MQFPMLKKKKNDPQRPSIDEVVDSERFVYLNA